MPSTNNRKKYTKPEIQHIKLDNDISLILLSNTPPTDAPGEGTNHTPSYFNTDPFKTNLT